MKSAALAFFLLIGSLAGTQTTSPSPTASSASFPAQLALRVPFEPTAFPSNGHTYLIYELHLTNFGPTTLYPNRLEVIDADNSATPPVGTFDGKQLEEMWQVAGAKSNDASD